MGGKRQPKNSYLGFDEAKAKGKAVVLSIVWQGIKAARGEAAAWTDYDLEVATRERQQLPAACCLRARKTTTIEPL
jgi:hypothetical protein